MKFCSDCGADQIAFEVPEGDNRPRFVCKACQTIHYQNPRLVVGTLPVFQGRVLICKRNIEPRFGKWTLPAGFMENGESLPEGAMRETYEESDAKVENLRLLTVLSVPRINQVHVMFLADMPSAHCAVTSESSEVKLVSRDQVPWNDLAFRTIRTTLEHYFHCLDTGQDFPVRVSDIIH